MTQVAEGFSIESTIDNARFGLIEDQVAANPQQVFGAYAQLVRASVDIAPYEDRDSLLAFGALQIFGDSAVRAFYGCGEPNYSISFGGSTWRIDSTKPEGFYRTGRRS